MPYYVYIMYSASLDRYYKGQTRDLSDRLKRHNNGLERSTRVGVPWELRWYCTKAGRSEAIQLERKLKHLNRVRLESFMERHRDGVAGPDG